MRFERFILISLLILFCSKAYTQTRKYAGSYFYGDTIPQGAIDIYPESDTTLLFSIYLINSNYHMGFNMGRIHIRKDSAIFENINVCRYEAFQQMLNGLGGGSGILWITHACQVQCEDPSYAQIIGVARTIRTEMHV